MQLDGNLIAIIGPNEAGKSSFLGALSHLHGTDELSRSGGSQDATRGVEYPDDHHPIIGTFLIEDVDKAAMSNIPGIERSRWFTLYKRFDGSRSFGISPKPERPLAERYNAVKSMAKILNRVRKYEKKADEGLEVGDAIERLISELQTDVQTLPDETLENIDKLRDLLGTRNIAESVPSVNSLIEKLSELHELESRDLAMEAGRALIRRLSPILMFGTSEINLLSEYDLNGIKASVPRALANLARLADLDLPMLIQRVEENDQGAIATIIRQANEGLAAIFANAWSQSPLEVAFTVSGTTLTILVKEEDAPYVRIAERSDGLRRYIALVAFIRLQNAEIKPILLIDEAETHLHYDAQADLVQMLARQQLTSKVIYTTHSVGCLPEDLGSGVRMVETTIAGTSRIVNWFWSANSAGFSTLLFGMGAETLAFIPIRYALVTEGAVDMILLPRMFREASSKDYLGFQIVPGLSEADRTRIIQLEHSSPRTIYLGDADHSGKGLISQVLQAGVSKNRTFNLPDPSGLGLVVEDFLDGGVYLAAVNEELERSHGNLYSIDASELPSSNRPKFIADWCKHRKISPPNKGMVAYRVLETDIDIAILDSRRSKMLAKLLSEMQKALGIQLT